MRPTRVFLLLTATRWFPVGLVVTVTTLLPIERGLTVAQTLTLVGFTGIVVFALELPTGGVADALGRKPLLVTAAAMQVLAAALFLTAHSFWQFAAAYAVMGVFRALDSGPLESWFVDAQYARYPGADVARPLAHQGTVLGGAIALGALLSGGLIWWHPIPAWSAMTLPYVVYLALAAVHLAMVCVVLTEPRRAGARTTAADRLRRALAAAAQAPGVVVAGLRLVRHDRVLASVLLVEVFWSTGMVVFETFQPIWLAEILDSEARAAGVMGPVASVGWGVFALGSALAGLVSRRLGVTWTAIGARVLNGLGAVWMGLVAGPAALVIAYLVTYGLHGAGGPVYNALLHRQANSRNRTTVLSMASMASFAAYAVASPTLGWTAAATTTQLAMVIGGAFSVLGAFCFVPALRREREQRGQPPRT